MVDSLHNIRKEEIIPELHSFLLILVPGSVLLPPSLPLDLSTDTLVSEALDPLNLWGNPQ